MKDSLPEDKSYWSRACKAARVYSGHPSKRCSSCPFPDCILDKPRLKKIILFAHIAKLCKAFDERELASVWYKIAKAMEE